jgi:ligand-binding sensor domain-containing protein
MSCETTIMLADDQYSLAGNSAYHIYEGQHGKLWIATDGGVSFYDGECKAFRLCT